MQDCWSLTCCHSWTLGSSSKFSLLTFFLWVLVWYMFVWLNWLHFLILKWGQACQWNPRDCAHADSHAGKSICQRDWLCRQHNKFYRKSRRQKFIFFWRLKRNLSLNICVCHKKSKIMNWIKNSITTIYM